MKTIIKTSKLAPIIYGVPAFVFTLLFVIFCAEPMNVPNYDINAPEVALNGDNSVLYEVSCYTGYESHGANGRNDNVSIATYQFPQGTWVEVEGFGQRRVDTVTAKRFSHRIDIWFGDTEEDYNRCLTFGLKYLEVNLI